MNILSWFIKSDFVKAQVLAVVRHTVTAIGAVAVAHGYADGSVVEAAMGFATAAVSFWLANVDVYGVDKKITVALNTMPPEYTDKVEVKELPLVGNGHNGPSSTK